MFFQEKNAYVLSFINEKHLNHYLDRILSGRDNYLFFRTDTLILNLQNELHLRQITDEIKYADLYYKEFSCTIPVPTKKLIHEVPEWLSFIEAESDYSVLFAIYSTTNKEFYAVLLKGEQNERLWANEQKEVEYNERAS